MTLNETTQQFAPSGRSIDSLAEALKLDQSFGGMAAQNIDGEALIAREASPSVLRQALDRTRRTQDLRWSLLVLRQLNKVEKTAENAFDLTRSHISALQYKQANAALDLYSKFAKKSVSWDNLDFEIAVGTFDVRRADAAIKRLLKKKQETETHELRVVSLLLSLGDASAASKRFHKVSTEAMGQIDGQIISIQLTLVNEGPFKALQLLDELLPTDLAVARELRASLLNLAGRYNEVLSLVQNWLNENPLEKALYSHGLTAARESDRLLELQSFLQAIFEKFPRDQSLAETLCGLAIELGDQNSRNDLLHFVRDRSSWTWMTLHFSNACIGGDKAEVDALFQMLRDDGVQFPSVRILYALYLYYFCADAPSLALAEQELRDVARTSKDSPGVQAIYLRLLLGTGQESEAADVFANLPVGLKKCAELRAFEMYFAAQAGANEVAVKGWTQHLRDSAHMALSAHSSYPSEVALNYNPSDDAILAFTTIFNGIEYVEWFLDYYRDLGIDHFFFCDNGSTDGTFEFLSKQADVSLFVNTGSFSASACGVFWINHLMRRFGVGHWCLHLDMDEALVFPGMDKGRTLRDFIGYLDQNGFQATAGLMVDIFPDFSDETEAEDLFAASKFIDTNYNWMRNELPPYYFIKGGMRSRLTGQSLLMTKSPLVKMTSEFAYIANNHQHTHVPIADVTTAVMHYKFIGKFKERFLEAVERGEHFQGARFYRILSNSLDKTAESGTGGLGNDSNVVEYTGPSQLVDLGILKSSAAWDQM